MWLKGDKYENAFKVADMIRTGMKEKILDKEMRDSIIESKATFDVKMGVKIYKENVFALIHG